MRIYPVDQQWTHTFLLEPYLQGAELINRAWQGIDFHSLTKAPLSLKERLISLITGIALMTPFVNTIIWVAWQTLGRPEKFFEPYTPELDPPLPILFIPPANVAEILDAPVKPLKSFGYNETSPDGVMRTQWTIKHYAERMIALQSNDKFSSTAIYNLSGNITEFVHQSQDGKEKVYIQQTDPKYIKIQITGKDPVSLELTESIPWIQQSTIGLRHFVLSKENELIFYGVLPENPLKNIPFAAKGPLLMKAIAKKIGHELVPGYGKLIKVEVSAWSFPYNTLKGTLWFDPRSGTLRKYIDPGLTSQKTGEFVRADPLPE